MLGVGRYGKHCKHGGAGRNERVKGAREGSVAVGRGVRSPRLQNIERKGSKAKGPRAGEEVARERDGGTRKIGGHLLATPIPGAPPVRVKPLDLCHDPRVREAKVLWASNSRLGRRRPLLALCNAPEDLSVDPGQDGVPASSGALCDEGLLRAVPGHNPEGRGRPELPVLAEDLAVVDAQLRKIDLKGLGWNSTVA